MTRRQIRCLNCQEPLVFHDSITQRYPEWRTLSSSPSVEQQKPVASGDMKTTLSKSASDSRKFSAPSLSSLTRLESSAGGAMGRSVDGAAPSSGSEYSQVSNPGDMSGAGGNLGHVTAQQGNLWDIVCGDTTPVDHPMCQDCTDKLLDCMDAQLKTLDDEAADYKRLLQSLQQHAERLDLNTMRLEHAKLQSEESGLRAELARLEAEEEDIDRQLDAEKVELVALNNEEERLWKVYRHNTRHLLELEQEDQSVVNQLNYVTEQLEKLSKTNVFNLTFHIWHAKNFGTINGFRLGRLPDEQVDWNEINAAWGQTTLLLSCLAKRLDMKFHRFELVPFGNYSYVKSVQNPDSAGSSGGKEKELPLYYTGGYKFLGNSKFDAGMVAFLDCLQQLREELYRKNRFCLPYAMAKDKIIDKDREYSVKIQFNSEERWTKAMKCMLMNLKWALAWITSLHS